MTDLLPSAREAATGLASPSDDLDRDFSGEGYSGSIYGNCPVQAKGTVLGQTFYFRARYSGWDLRIGNDGVNGDPIAAGRYGTDFEAGWMPKPFAINLLHSLLKLFIEQERIAENLKDGTVLDKPSPPPESEADFTFVQPDVELRVCVCGCAIGRGLRFRVVTCPRCERTYTTDETIETTKDNAGRIRWSSLPSVRAK